MRIARIFIVLLMGESFILGACAGQTKTPPVPPTTGPAAFTTSNLSVVPQVIRPGEDADISVTVTNTGGETGTYTVVVKVNGATARTKDVTLAGGASERVTLSIPLWLDGTHEITIDQLTGIIRVYEG